MPMKYLAIGRKRARPLTVAEISNQLASGMTVNVSPFIAAPVDRWVRVRDDGSCGGDYGSRGDARWALQRYWEPGRTMKAQTVRWYGQPMRVKGGPVITRVRDLSKHPGSTVYTAGRGRQKFHVLIAEVTPAVGASVARTLFKGVLCPPSHAAVATRKTRPSSTSGPRRRAS